MRVTGMDVSFESTKPCSDQQHKDRNLILQVDNSFTPQNLKVTPMGFTNLMLTKVDLRKSVHLIFTLFTLRG